MKKFQVCLPDDLHEAGVALAKSRCISLADVIREAMEVQLENIALMRTGGRVIHERSNGERAEIVIPGINRRFK